MKRTFLRVLLAICLLAGQASLSHAACTQIWDPVCGVNGITYSNGGCAADAGVTVAYTGECTPPTYNVNAYEVLIGGSIYCPSPVAAGGSSTCIISVWPGYHLDFFRVNGVDNIAGVINNTYTITNIQADQTVFGSFSINTYTVSTPMIYIGGSISCQTPVSYGGSSICIISRDPDYALTSFQVNSINVPLSGSNWSVINNRLSYTINNIQANKTVTGSFALPPSYTVTGFNDANGSVTCESPVHIGNNSVCTVSPVAGYSLMNFQVNGVDKLFGVNNNSYTIVNVQGPQTVTGAFSANTAPGAPSVNSVWGGNGQATVYFTAPTDKGGLPITGYTVTATPGGVTSSGTTSPITVSGLTNGTYYTFTAVAANALGDGIASPASNPVLVYNPQGNDFDGDLVLNAVDNCPLIANLDQLDSDQDGAGDLCDPQPTIASEWRDTDGDGFGDNADNCVTVANPSQADADQDAIGDACDASSSPNYGSVIDAPHNHAHGVSCSDCHSYSMWWQHSPMLSSDPAYGTRTDAICLKCHGLGIGSINAVHSSAAMGTNHNPALGNWSVKCVDCHSAHKQSQLEWRGTDSTALYLVKGTIAGNITVSGGQTTFNYQFDTPGNPDHPEWSDPARWSNKSDFPPATGLILVEDTVTALNTYQVVVATATEITIKGGLNPAAGGRPFGLIYGRMINSATTGGKSVKFFDPNVPHNAGMIGGFTDPVNTATPMGLCQVCHTQTQHWKNDGTGNTHSTGTVCTACHDPRQGFKM